MKDRLILLPKHWQAMREHVAKQAPLEACGILAGKNDRVEKIILIRNQAQSPVRFQMDPKEQLDAFEWMDRNHQELLGIFTHIQLALAKFLTQILKRQGTLLFTSFGMARMTDGTHAVSGSRTGMRSKSH